MFIYESSAHAYVHVCLCVQTLVQPPSMAESKMTTLKVRILLDVLNKFQIIDPNH